MTGFIAILVGWVLLYVSCPFARAQPIPQSSEFEALQRKYEAALQEIERLRSALEALQRERVPAQPPPSGGTEGAPGGDFFQAGNAHFVAQRYAEAIAAYTKAIEMVPRDARAYKHRGLAHAKLGNVQQA